MSLHQPSMKLPDIRVPRLSDKLPELKGGLKSSTSSSTSDPLGSAKTSARDEHLQTSKSSERKAKRTNSSTLDTSSLHSPTSCRVGPIEPNRRRSTSSSWITVNTSSPSPTPLVPPVESPKRATSQPTLLNTAHSVLIEQAQNSMESVQPIPAFSIKKPLSLGSTDSPLGAIGDDLASQVPRAITPTKLNELKVRNKREMKSVSDLDSQDVLKPLTPPLPSITPRSLPPISKEESKSNIKIEDNKTDAAVESVMDKVQNKLEVKSDNQVADEVDNILNSLDRSESRNKGKVDSKAETEPAVESKVESKLEEKSENVETNKLEHKSPSHMRPAATKDVSAPRDKVSPLQRCMTTMTVQVFVGTWNMQGKPPPASGLELFISPRTHDIYAIGTEECETSIQRALLSPIKQKWEDKLCATLGPEYIMLPTSTLGAVHLAVFVHLSLLPILSEVRIGSIPTGLGNVVANKGGVAVTFQLGTTSFAFVAAHFTAHHNKIEQRNADFHRINNMLTLSAPTQVQIPPTPAPPQPPQLRKAKRRSASLSGSPSASPSLERRVKDDKENKEDTGTKTEQEAKEANEKKDGEKEVVKEGEEAKGARENGNGDPKAGDEQNGEARLTTSESANAKLEGHGTLQDSLSSLKQSTGLTDNKQQEKDEKQAEDRKSRRLSQQLLPQQRAFTTTLTERFDRVFWFGDLNYRINGNKKIVEETVKQNLIEVLVANDQLMIEKKKGNVFQGYLEGPLNFTPTYKYDAGTDNFDTSAKARVPSWTDRILFKTSEHVHLQNYTSCGELRYTDHKPVYASFGVGFAPPDPSTALGGGSGKGNGSKVCTIL